MLQLTRPIAFFDTETTGVSIASDRIIEICIMKVNVDGSTQVNTFRINPGMPIPAEASAIHGIFDKDVADKPKFAELANTLFALFEGCDLGGYNSNSFDVPLLTEEFLRLGINFMPETRKMVDVMSVFKKMEQRNLSAAYRFYCGKELTDAHSAEADTRATYEILLAQIEKYDALKNDVNFLHDFSFQSRYVDFEGKIVKNSKGEECINFGKHKGKSFIEILKFDPSYFEWMLRQEFSLYTKQLVKGLVEKYKTN